MPADPKWLVSRPEMLSHSHGESARWCLALMGRYLSIAAAARLPSGTRCSKPPFKTMSTVLAGRRTFLDEHVADAGDPRAAVDHQPDDRGVAAAVGRPALASSQQRGELLICQHVLVLRSHLGRLDPRHGVRAEALARPR